MDRLKPDYPAAAIPRPGVYPFWFWNGEEDEARLSRQLERMEEAGCRGVVLHSRMGNRVEYLSPRWLALVRHACLEAKRLGLRVWLYDEDGFPSGNAGMGVQRARPDLVQKALVFAYEATDPSAPAYAAYDPATLRPLDERAVPGGTEALRFRVVEYRRHVDTLSPDSCRIFLERTHERYLEAVGDLFGDPVEAVYTDDESYLVWDGSGLVFSPALEAAYRARYRCDLREDLPLLVEEAPGFEEARLRYHAAAEDLFLRNFIRPQREWCAAHGLAYVGHLCGDEGELSTSIKNFGLAQPYHLLEDVPSIDDYLSDRRDLAYLRETHNDSAASFTNKTRRRFPCLLPYVHAGSVARIFKPGRPFSSETLAFTGWEAPASFLDAQTLFELAMGANLLTPHAFYYTVGGGTRFDCPPSYFSQQPYFPMLRDLFAKWTRIAKLLLQGEPAGSTLVLSPQSVLAARRGRDFRVAAFPDDPCARFRARRERSDNALDAYEHALAGTFVALLRRHVSFEMLEEALLPRHASLDPASGELLVGSRRYRAVCLPTEAACPFLPETRALLDRFRQSGGTVLEPDRIDSLPPDADLPDGSDEVLAAVRILPGGARLEFLVNLSGRDLPFRLRRETPFRLYDPATDAVVFEGETLPEGAVLRRGGAAFLATAAPGGLPPLFGDAQRMDFDAGAFAPDGLWLPLVPADIRRLRPNLFRTVLKTDAPLALDIGDGARATAFYAEDLDPADLGPAATPAPGHPIDFAYRGAAPARPVEGPCRLSLRTRRDFRDFYVEGDFSVDGASLRAPAPLRMGDLSTQGMPHYWGCVEYRFRFPGRARRLRLSLAGGMAEVFVNGVRCGVVCSDPCLLPVDAATCDGENELVVRLANTAQNFLSDKPPVPFGLSSAEIDRGRPSTAPASGRCPS